MGNSLQARSGAHVKAIGDPLSRVKGGWLVGYSKKIRASPAKKRAKQTTMMCRANGKK